MDNINNDDYDDYNYVSYVLSCESNTVMTPTQTQPWPPLWPPPCQGNKTLALYATALKKCKNMDYIMMIDNDVVLPSDLHVPMDIFTDPHMKHVKVPVLDIWLTLFSYRLHVLGSRFLFSSTLTRTQPKLEPKPWP